MRVSKFYHFKMSIILFLFYLALGIIALIAAMKIENANMAMVIGFLAIEIISLVICIYEIIIIILIVSASKGQVVNAKYINTKRILLLFETLMFDVDGKIVNSSPILFLRGYEIVYRKNSSNIYLIRYKNRYFVAYK